MAEPDVYREAMAIPRLMHEYIEDESEISHEDMQGRMDCSHDNQISYACGPQPPSTLMSVQRHYVHSRACWTSTRSNYRG